MPTRRSSRHRFAASATPVDEVTAGEIRVAPAGRDAIAVPSSRREARARAAQAASAIDLSPMPASSRRVRPVPPVPVPDATVEQLLAASLVIVSAEAGTETEELATVAGEPVAQTTVAEQTSPAETPVAEHTSSAGSSAAASASAEETAAPASADPFVAASRTLRAQPAAETEAAAEENAAGGTETATDGHVAPRRPARRRFVAAGTTVGVMGIAGLLAVSMTLPAEAVAVAQGVQQKSAMSLVASASADEGEGASDEEIQAFVASSDVQNETLERTEDYSTASLVDLAAEQGIRYSDSLYTNDPDAAIQWPFVVGVAMSSGYGQRYGRLHAGIDLVPGEGAPIQAIADGTVRIATESGGAYGVTVYIDHIIDGEVVTSHYAHMQYGSLRVKTGDKVQVGDIIGLVGNTGRSYGAHLHFEIIINGSTVDPLPWMRENAGRYDGVTPVS